MLLFAASLPFAQGADPQEQQALLVSSCALDVLRDQGSDGLPATYARFRHQQAFPLAY